MARIVITTNRDAKPRVVSELYKRRDSLLRFVLPLIWHPGGIDRRVCGFLAAPGIDIAALFRVLGAHKREGEDRG